ncbi:MAG: DegV family protein [Streptococcus sp.]
MWLSIIMHTLSGTCEASRQGAILSGADVTVIDSGFIDQCLKFQVVEAAKLAQAGASLEDIVAHVEEVKSKSELHIGVSTLENLVKGGRIGRVTGLLSSLLNIRVIMELKDYQLNTIAKGRGAKTFTRWLDSYIDSYQGPQGVLRLVSPMHGTPDFAHELAEKLEVLGAPISILETGSIIQTHTGEGAFAVMVRYE